MAMSNQMQEVIAKAIEQGWSHQVTGSGHHKLVPPGDGDIVVASSTPGDQRSFKNFLASMKRNGFKEMDEREILMEKRRVRGLTNALRELMRSKPGKPYNTDELKLIAHARMPGCAESSVSSSIDYMHKLGEIVRLAPGQYRWAGEVQTMASVVTQPVLEQQGEQSPVGEVDKLLADFLEIAARVETVLRKHAKIEQKNQELKRLLMGED
jgi:hypothetical protein